VAQRVSLGRPLGAFRWASPSVAEFETQVASRCAVLCLQTLWLKDKGAPQRRGRDVQVVGPKLA